MTPTVIVRFGTLVAAAGLLVQPGFSQGAGQQGGAGTAAPPAGAGAGSTTTTPAPGRGTAPTRPTTPTPGQQQQQQQQQQQMEQPIFLSGRVLMEDGTPAANAVIQRVCNGSPRSEGYTDSRGYFSIQLGARNGAMIHDASEDLSGGFGAANGSFGGLGNPNTSMGPMRGGMDSRLFGCELRAQVPGYRSQVVPLANRRPMDPPDIGTILIHRLGQSEGTTVSAISLAAPKDAKKAYDKGLDAMKKKKADDAIKNFEKAVEVYPKYAAAWNDLGRVQAAKGDLAAARKSFATAAEADPKFVHPVLELAMLEWKDQKWQEVADLTAKVIKLDSFEFPQAHFMNALSNYNLKNFDAAEKSAREAVRLDTRKQFATSYRLLGVLLANRQDYSGAAEQFKTYLTIAPQAQDANIVRGQLSKLEELLAAGKQ